MPEGPCDALGGCVILPVPLRVASCDALGVAVVLRLTAGDGEPVILWLAVGVSDSVTVSLGLIVAVPVDA